ncbi:type II toxin-antitoxin system HicB family antitoxin [bacterium]|nr:type II toxin-antitoxin system HicB family antitoxin [bacterium]
MISNDKYTKLVEWSEEDQCYIGSCPELFYGGCHGADLSEVFHELCQIVEETIEMMQSDGKLLPAPLSGKDFVNAMQSIA